MAGYKSLGAPLNSLTQPPTMVRKPVLSTVSCHRPSLAAAAASSFLRGDFPRDAIGGEFQRLPAGNRSDFLMHSERE